MSWKAILSKLALRDLRRQTSGCDVRVKSFRDVGVQISNFVFTPHFGWFTDSCSTLLFAQSSHISPFHVPHLFLVCCSVVGPWDWHFSLSYSSQPKKNKKRNTPSGVIRLCHRRLTTSLPRVLTMLAPLFYTLYIILRIFCEC